MIRYRIRIGKTHFKDPHYLVQLGKKPRYTSILLNKSPLSWKSKEVAERNLTLAKLDFISAEIEPYDTETQDVPTSYHGYRVTINRNLVNEHREEGEYGAWSAEYDNEFSNVCRDNVYPDIASTLDLNPGDPCYVIWAEWSTSDSFGASTCSHTEALAIFTEQTAAQALVDAIKDTKNYTETITTPDGQTHFIQCGWSGYFETLEAIHIQETKITPTEK